MKKILLLILPILVIVAGAAFSKTASQTIILKDGSTLKGQLINVENGSYIIETPNMGQVKVSADQVQNISNAGAADAVPSVSQNKISPTSLDTVKTNMLADPEIMSLIQELMQDPEITEIMKNPSLMQDALSMDPERIQNNPDVQKLMRKPAMQKIIAKTTQKLQN